jgi:hypothetical protein
VARDWLLDVAARQHGRSGESAVYGDTLDAFGSVLLPLKAIAMNLLSLTATFGGPVRIFQDGHLRNLLCFDAGAARQAGRQHGSRGDRAVRHRPPGRERCAAGVRAARGDRNERC